MAAGAKLPANNNGSTSNRNFTFTTNDEIIISGRTTSGAAYSITVSLDWSRDEQSMMEELLHEYASDSTAMCYARIATKLNNKTARDVAVRYRWMTAFQKQENGKRRQDDGNLSKRHKNKREKVADEDGKASSHSINYANGGELGKHFEQNEQAMHQISANFSALKVYENISLFSQTRDNIVVLLNELNDIKNMPDLMKRMPPLSLKVNDELVNTILNQSSMLMKF